MQEVWGSNPRLGRLRVNPFQVSGGMSTLQSSASDLQSTTQGIPSRSIDSSESNTNKETESRRAWLYVLRHRCHAMIRRSTMQRKTTTYVHV